MNTPTTTETNQANTGIAIVSSAQLAKDIIIASMKQRLDDADSNPYTGDDDNHCRICNAPYADGGDGFDGMCPSCADADDRIIDSPLQPAYLS